MSKPILLGYRRKSMVRDRADLISPERQARSCELWLEMHGDQYTIEWYEDVEGHRSGREEKGRPGWQRLMTQLDRPEVTGVIADSFDRMYRNVHQFLNFLNRMEQLGKKLVTVKEGLDTSSTLGRAIVTILMVIYQLESDQTSDRMKANVAYKREVLGRHWGPTPFGCDRNEEGQLIPTTKTYWFHPITGQALPHHCPAQLPLAEFQPPNPGYELRRYHDGLLHLYQLYATGQNSYLTVANLANAAGWRYYADATGTPREFTHDDIRRLTSFWRLYQGELPTGNLTNGKNKPVFQGGHTPILPIELCESVGVIKNRRSHQYTQRLDPTGQPRVYLLSNILYCSTCNRPLKGQIQNGYRIYRHYGGKQGCPEKWIVADDLEKQVLDTLIHLGQSDLLEAIAAEAKALAREVFAQNDATRSLLPELDRQRHRLTKLEDMYLDGDIDKDRYRQRKSELLETIAKFEDQLYAATQTINFDQILTRLIATFTRLADASPETKKTLINSVIQRLDAGGGKVVHLTPQSWARPFF